MNNLIQLNGKWYTQEVYQQIKECEEKISDYDLLQLTKKIQLNSFYGSLLSNSFRWGVREMIGASVTFSGRGITTHMIEQVALLLTGESSNLNKSFNIKFKDGKAKIENIYQSNNANIIYSDTDSLEKSSIINTTSGDLTIEELFHLCSIKKIDGEKEYGIPGVEIKSLTYDEQSQEAIYKPIQWVYRHKVKKARWKITLQSGKHVEVTNDHSLMVERNGNLIEVKPSEILETDVFITIL